MNYTDDELKAALEKLQKSKLKIKNLNREIYFLNKRLVALWDELVKLNQRETEKIKKDTREPMTEEQLQKILNELYHREMTAAAAFQFIWGEQFKGKTD